jgi:hypothetical protein
VEFCLICENEFSIFVVLNIALINLQNQTFVLINFKMKLRIFRLILLIFKCRVLQNQDNCILTKKIGASYRCNNQYEATLKKCWYRGNKVTSYFVLFVKIYRLCQQIVIKCRFNILCKDSGIVIFVKMNRVGDRIVKK